MDFFRKKSQWIRVNVIIFKWFVLCIQNIFYTLSMSTRVAGWMIFLVYIVFCMYKMTRWNASDKIEKKKNHIQGPIYYLGFRYIYPFSLYAQCTAVYCFRTIKITILCALMVGKIIKLLIWLKSEIKYISSVFGLICMRVLYDFDIKCHIQS